MVVIASNTTESRAARRRGAGLWGVLLVAALGTASCGKAPATQRPSHADVGAGDDAGILDAASDAAAGDADPDGAPAKPTCEVPEGACTWGEAWPWCPPPEKPLPVPTAASHPWYQTGLLCEPSLQNWLHGWFAPVTARHRNDGGLLIAHAGWVGRFNPDWSMRWTFPSQPGTSKETVQETYCPKQWRAGGFTAIASADDDGALVFGQGCRTWETPADTACHDGWVVQLDAKGLPVGKPLLLGGPTAALGDAHPFQDSKHFGYLWRTIARGSMVRVGPARWVAFFPRWRLDLPQLLLDSPATHYAGRWHVAVIEETSKGLEVVHEEAIDFKSIPLRESKTAIGTGTIIPHKSHPGYHELFGGESPQNPETKYWRYPAQWVSHATLSKCGHAVFALEPAGVIIAFDPSGHTAWHFSLATRSASMWTKPDGSIQIFGCESLFGKQDYCEVVTLSAAGVFQSISTPHLETSFVPDSMPDTLYVPRFGTRPWRKERAPGGAWSLTDEVPPKIAALRNVEVIAERAGRYFTYGSRNRARYNYYKDKVGLAGHDHGVAVVTYGGWADEKLAGVCAQLSPMDCIFPKSCRNVQACDPVLGCDLPAYKNGPGLPAGTFYPDGTYMETQYCTGDKTCDFSSIPWKCVPK